MEKFSEKETIDLEPVAENTKSFSEVENAIHSRSTQTESPPSPWRGWLEEFGPRLLLFARQQTRSLQDAEDILQDALVKLATRVNDGNFIGDQEAWSSYVFATIRRLAIDVGRGIDRRRRREQFVSESEVTDFCDPWFESVSADTELAQFVAESVQKLPKKLAEVITLKIWGNKTFQEISEILGISINTVASRYRYAIENLRRKLEPRRAKNDI